MLSALVLAACHPSSGLAGKGDKSRSRATSSTVGSGGVGANKGHPAPSLPVCNQMSQIASWSVDRRVAQLIVVPVDESNVSQAAPLVAQGAGGVFLFGSYAPPGIGAQIAALAATAPAGVAPIVMADEEGGGIQSLSNVVGSLPWPRMMAETYTPAQVQAQATQVARNMSRIGVTMDLAPVLGIDSGPGPDAQHPIGARSFGGTPAMVSTYALAFARGLMAGGVVPVVKHFPGLGRASYNTDFGPAYTPPLSSLETFDLIPFENAIAAKVPAVMVSNASIPGLTRGPASLSKAAIQGLLRQKLGFKGLVLTDSLSAQAISDIGLGVGPAAVKAVEAGVQMILFTAPAGESSNQASQQVLNDLASAVNAGQISQAQLDSAVAAVLQVKNVNLCNLHGGGAAAGG